MSFMGSILHRLLTSYEYDDLEDVVLAEGAFVEVDKVGEAIRQVYLGLTIESLVLATQSIINYKEHPDVYYNVEQDLRLEGLEVKWIIPICFVDILPIDKHEEHVLKIVTKSGRLKYFEQCTSPDWNDIWCAWLDRLKYLKFDPYGYVDALYNSYDIPFSRKYDISDRLDKDHAIPLGIRDITLEVEESNQVTDNKMNSIVERPDVHTHTKCGILKQKCHENKQTKQKEVNCVLGSQKKRKHRKKTKIVSSFQNLFHSGKGKRK